MPTRTQEGLTPKSYPQYPDSFSESDVVEFAIEYEKAYRYNQYVAFRFQQGIGEVDVVARKWDSRRARGGYVVGITGEVKAAPTRSPPDGNESTTQTPEPIPFSDNPFGAWYFLTENFAMRNGTSDPLLREETPTPDLSDASVIVCSFE